MAAAVPVVATRVGGVPELIIDGETGMLVEPGDADALASAIATLAADPDRRSRLGRSGAKRAAEEFSLEGAARKVVDLYDELLAGAG